MSTTHLSRDRLLLLVTLAVLLAAIPHAIVRIVRTGDPYLLTAQFFQDILRRLSGPGRLRFLFQPIAATLIGVREGKKDADSEKPPFVWALIFHAGRGQSICHALASTRNLVCLAILIDLLSQALIFRELRPGAALVVGPMLIALPYTLARAIANRVRTARR